MRAQCANCRRVEFAVYRNVAGEPVWKPPLGWTTVIRGKRVAVVCRECAGPELPPHMLPKKRKESQRRKPPHASTGVVLMG